jgi:hypothetical protein
MQLPWATSAPELFRVKPENHLPSLKLEVDDGEIGYLAQVYVVEKKIDMTSPPDAIALGAESIQRSQVSIMLDVDFSTKAPIPVESFDIHVWLSGWQRALNKDADRLLNVPGGK